MRVRLAAERCAASGLTALHPPSADLVCSRSCESIERGAMRYPGVLYAVRVLRQQAPSPTEVGPRVVQDFDGREQTRLAAKDLKSCLSEPVCAQIPRSDNLVRDVVALFPHAIAKVLRQRDNQRQLLQQSISVLHAYLRPVVKGLPTDGYQRASDNTNQTDPCIHSA